MFLEFAARGRNAPWRYLAATVLALVLATLVGVALMVGLMLAGLVPPDLSAQLLRPTRPVTFFIANGAMFGVVLLGFVAAIRLVHKKRVTDVIGSWSWPLFAGGAAIWFGVQVALTLIDLAIAPRGFSVTATNGTVAMALAAAGGLSIQTFAEEFVFRGYLTQALLLATRRPLVAATLSGLLFGALHVPNGTPQAIGAAAFGVVTALITIRTGGIAFSYGLHLVNNLFGAVFVVSASDVFSGSPGLITQNTPHLMWWDLGTAVVALVALGWTFRANKDPIETERSVAGATASTP
jgi:membrane protease YdiL (CAAX protease family)